MLGWKWFLVDKAGLILTNSHVITSSTYTSVQVKQVVQVQAILLAEDKQQDITVLCELQSWDMSGYILRKETPRLNMSNDIKRTRLFSTHLVVNSCLINSNREHKELLAQMAKSHAERPPMISKITFENLQEL